MGHLGLPVQTLCPLLTYQQPQPFSFISVTLRQSGEETRIGLDSAEINEGTSVKDKGEGLVAYA